MRLEQSESSVLRPLLPLPTLLSLCKEETSGSLRSVRTLSLLVVALRGMLSLEVCPSSCFRSRESMSCNLDQRRLLHSKVHLSLIANRSSSSESSLWGKIFQDIKWLSKGKSCIASHIYCMRLGVSVRNSWTC